MMDTRYCRRKGHWLHCRDEWWLWLVHAQRCCFGFTYDRLKREFVLILGCRVVERSATGVPCIFAGGVHLVLALDHWFSAPRHAGGERALRP